MADPRRAVHALVLLAALAALPAGPHAEPVAPESAQQAAERLRQDPALGGKRMEWKLRFKPGKQDNQEIDRPRQTWWQRAVRWMTESGRWLVWVLGAVLVAIVLVRARIWMRERGALHLPAPAGRPTHVQSLDIRPEHLPADIGAAAWSAWTQGDHRAALALLYRGALSRLVHERGVALRASDTEGECLQLARQALPAEAGDFFESLVRAWQAAVYAGRAPDDDRVRTLCAGFAGHFGVARDAAA